MDITGIDITQIISFIPHAGRIGIKILGTDADAVLSELTYSDMIAAREGSGIIANGAVTTLLDTALGMAVVHKKREMCALATLDLRMDFLRSCTPFSSVYARTECIRLTREVAFVRGEAWCEDPARPVAQSIAAFSISDFDAGAWS
ncbi:PaaI family thioesterase [Emcibacter sp.]|uniref:PaaI family thioesterase n=1 Tax=Emcibacter sp. TaxID=1979954 RepID=UPI002AA92CF0|nr:PaaI family thioesterase [Emcibacter sp.]